MAYLPRREFMAKDVMINLENRPGILADLGNILGGAGVNLMGGCGFDCEGKGTLHFLVEDPQVVHAALEGTVYEVAEVRDVLLVDVVDRPGEMGKLARQIADAGANIELMYLSTSGHIVIGVDDLEKVNNLQ
jgi:hypothetical protein